MNAVRPGRDPHRHPRPEASPAGSIGSLAAVPMQRGGQPDEVAATILWLASDAASYITATTVNCSGGR